VKFVDEVKISVSSGAGGNGCVSFRREKFVPRGGPNGGDGGNGGSVYLVGNKKLATLYDLKINPHYRASKGQHGQGKERHGSQGKDCDINVPLGVVVRDEDNNILGEILSHGEKLLVARGGKGGRGNCHFVTAKNRAPRFAELGETGEARRIKLELKLLSDVGVVGLPNCGKSTLLSAITNAQPKIAEYPFTTLNPNLGILRSERKSIVLADIPGIIKDAHLGKGLGHKFLRHIERTNLLVMLIDISIKNPLEQYKVMLNEFRLFNKLLLKKPRIVVFNKIDLIKEIPEFSIDEQVFYISALKKIGLKDLIAFLMQ